MASLGLFGMLAALAWCAWSLVRVLIGPARKKALGRVGFSVLAFFGSALVMGSNLAPSTRVKQNGSVVATSTVQEAPKPEPQSTGSTPLGISSAQLVVSGRYQTSPTMVSLVVPDFTNGEESQVADLARAECHGASFCSVGIWTNADLAPRKLKMTDTEVAGRLGHYAHNSKTGLDRILWNCALSPHQNSECLP
jgi:hypothetical protein